MATKTKADLERELKAFEGIGNKALEFADEHGLCSEVEDFLRDNGIPFDEPKAFEVAVTILVAIEPERRTQPSIEEIRDNLIVEASLGYSLNADAWVEDIEKVEKV